MLPSLIAREIKAELENFLASSFPVSTAGFKGEDDTGLIEQFLHDPAKTDNLLKGPWLEIKLPFRTASSATESPLSHIQLGFTPYMHQQRAFERLAGLEAQSTLVATGTGSGKTGCRWMNTCKAFKPVQHCALRHCLNYALNGPMSTCKSYYPTP